MEPSSCQPVFSLVSAREQLFFIDGQNNQRQKCLLRKTLSQMIIIVINQPGKINLMACQFAWCLAPKLSVRPGSHRSSGGYSFANCRLYSCIFHQRKRDPNQLRRVLAKGRHLLQILLKALWPLMKPLFFMANKKSQNKTNVTFTHTCSTMYKSKLHETIGYTLNFPN